MVRGGNTYFYHHNAHGDIIALTDASGTVVAEYDYDAWGNPVSTGLEGSVVNPYRYAGYRYDSETGMYYLNARYYAPEIGRFITRDSFHGFEDEPASLNQYAYAHGNPVMYVDPSGNIANALIGAAMGALINYGIYYLEVRLGMRRWNYYQMITVVGTGAAFGAFNTGIISGFWKFQGLLYKAGFSAKFISRFKIYNKLKQSVIMSLTKKEHTNMSWAEWARNKFWN